MKIYLQLLTTVLFCVILFCSHQTVQAQSKLVYQYPTPNAINVSPTSGIGIRSSLSIDAKKLTNDLFIVIGSQSGTHTGKVTLARDNRTTIFTPSKAFWETEIVSVNCPRGIPIIGGSLLRPSPFNFTIIKKTSAAPAPSDDPANSTSFVFLGKDQTLALKPPTIVISQKNSPADGAFFLSNYAWQGNSSTIAPCLLIVDNDGKKIEEKELTTGHSALDLRPHSNGELLYFDQKEFRYHEVDSNLNDIRDFGSPTNYQIDNHEIIMFPDSSYLVLADEYYQQDMSQSVTGGSRAATITGNVIEEFDADNNLLFEWRGSEHFKVTDATHEILTGKAIDYCHANALAVDNDGNILLSSRHMDEITKINRETGEIIWRWGGKNNQFLFTNDTLGFSHQHSIRVLPNGHYILFDNGNYHTPKPFSRACEYIIDSTKKTAELVWDYHHSPNLFAMFMGSVQRLENGNTLIGWGSDTNVIATEVTPKGEIAFEMEIPGGNISYRVWKFPWQKPLAVIAASPKGIDDLNLSNYPNPASSNTTISFSLTEPALIMMKIHDALGRTIKNMDLGWRTNGFYSLGLDVSDMTRGVYYYTLTANGRKATKRMIVE